MTTLHLLLPLFLLSIVLVVLVSGSSSRVEMELIEAVRAGDAAEVREMINSPADYDFDVDSVDDMGRSAMHWAAMLGHREMVDALMSAGAFPNGKDSDGNTPFTLADRHGWSDITNDLRFAWSGLMSAALGGSAEDIESALATTVDGHLLTSVLERDWSGATPMHFASRSTSKEAVEALFNHGADVNAVNKVGDTPLLWGAGRLNADFVQYLLDIGGDAVFRNQHDEDALSVAVSACAHRVAEFAAGDAVPPEDSDMTAAQIIKETVVNTTSIIDALLSFGADIHRRDSKFGLLHFVAELEGNQDLLKLLVETYGVDPNRSGDGVGTPLALAQTSGSTMNVVYLETVTAPPGGEEEEEEEPAESVTIMEPAAAVDDGDDNDHQHLFEYPNGTVVMFTEPISDDQLRDMLDEHYRLFPPPEGTDDLCNDPALRAIEEAEEAEMASLSPEELERLVEEHVKAEMEADRKAQEEQEQEQEDDDDEWDVDPAGV